MDAELTLAPSGRQAASCRRLRGHGGQPPGIGEVLAGILLGPSLLGRIAADVSAYILPPSVAPFLGVIAQIGVILYMFLVGLELNADLLRDRAHAIVAISHASIVAPFVLGSWLALYLYPRLSSSDVPFTSPTPNATAPRSYSRIPCHDVSSVFRHDNLQVSRLQPPLHPLECLICTT